jgi:hypothetical protein
MSEKLFRVIYEKNNKEGEVFIHYCQYTENEVELDKFCKIINRSLAGEMCGDFVEFYAATNKLIPESAVNAHIGIQDINGYARMFQKHTGSFKCPEFEYSEENTHELAHELDELLYSCKLGYLFSDNPHAW